MKQPTINSVNRRSIRIGFVPLNDAAPLVMADELGLFKKYGVRVSLQRELGWATIRDKIIYGELEAAQALAAMPFAATLGLGSIRCECLAAFVLNLNGNAITLSESLWQQGIRDGASLRAEIIRARREKTFTFGIVHRFSSHRHLLAKWLVSHRIDPERDVRMVVLPPSQMVANLSTGNVDGFCVGEPWNSVAIAARDGWCAETSLGIDPGHPEKVLMVRHNFAEEHAAEHLAILGALLEACEFCDHPENSETIARILAQPQYVGAAVGTLLRSMSHFDFGHGISKNIASLSCFHRDEANEPDQAKAIRVLDSMRGALSGDEKYALKQTVVDRVFRPDIFARAATLRSSTPQTETEHENETELQTA